ncbi:MAG: M1 family aminopeptidase [Bacteroidota bacterium]
MKLTKNKFALLLMLLATSVLNAKDSNPEEEKNSHQKINSEIDVHNSYIKVTDSLYVVNSNFEDKSLKFSLNENLKLKVLNKGLKLKSLGKTSEEDSYINYEINAKKLSDKKTLIVLEYEGVINDEIKSGAAEYARGFSETQGMISKKGIYMGGSTYWTPSFGENTLSSFELTVKIDSSYNIVSQGQRTINKVEGDKRTVKYSSPEPMDEVYLIGAQWKEYSMPAGKVEVQAFLRTPDDKLAYKYLGVTSGYLKMYETLIGEYPYTKFALVENFWETGYGMPSFTLLGEKVIRFPWILFSSYPHELLHNYWGNSVFVDYSEGNWCEGITAYMADHLMAEQKGGGAVYRRNTLQKFTDYVNEENDFPVKEFLNRNNSAQEAVGYGKSLMANNMLRLYLGDNVFVKSYQHFYENNKFRKASFTDIKNSFETVSGKDLDAFFDQWINRTGAPTLKISDINVKSDNGSYNLKFKLNQVQKEEAFDIKVPVAIYLEGANEVIWKTASMDKKEHIYEFALDKKPLKIEVDPQFNLMRRLNRKEVPSSLSQVFGNTQSTLILPGKSANLEAYKAMAETWKKTQESQGKNATIVLDSDLEKLPADQAVWVLGFENKFNTKELQTNYADYLGTEKIEQIKSLSTNGSLVYSTPNTANINYSVGFVGANSDEAVAALTRKLLHYGKYGYLGFEGDEANNVLKGSLPALDSPLNVKISDGETQAKLNPRKALYESQQKGGRPRN